MKYRPVAPEELDALVVRLESLMASTVLPWEFDAEAGAFYVVQNDEKMYITFGEGDVETELVRLVIANLPLLLAALDRRYYFLRLEGTHHGKQRD